MDKETVTVVSMFEEQASVRPEQIAVIGNEKSYTYKVLNERANAVAHSLLMMGLVPEERVLIYLPRVIENYVATFGILKAGGAFVNASVSYPFGRVKDIFETASCRFIITNRETLNEKSELFRELNVIPLLIEQLVVGQNKTNPDIRITENSLCYVIFTSGSTGKPKGVMIEHGNLANFLDKSSDNTESYQMYKHGTVMLAMAQFTFDMSIMEAFWAFSSGMTLVMANDSQIMDVAAMHTLLKENGVDALAVTPSYMNMLVSVPFMSDVIKNIKVIDFGAEAFPPSLYDKIRQINADAVLMNGYGPTEATISCTVKILESGNDITIGYPNGNVSTYIVDENLCEVARGCEGELLICGKGVGRGYMNLPDKTKEVFVEHLGMRAYRSGDYAIMRDDGEIEYRGRRDHMVKLRGLRIELGEIEQVIGTHPMIQNCVATVFDNKLLVLYYTSPNDISVSDVKDYEQEKLPHYLIPDVTVKLSEMPLTNNLKIDRNALPRPQIEQDVLVAPTNETETKLLEIITGIEPKMPQSITADIIGTGISSLGLMGLIAMIESEFLVSISIADVFENPDVLRLSAFIGSKKRRRVFRPLDRYPVSKSQVTTFNDFKKRPGDMCWNLNYYYEMPTSIDPKRLAKAVTGAFVIHPELLSTFIEEDGTLWQVPADDELMFIPEIIEISDKDWEQKIPNLGKAFNLTGKDLLFELCIYVTESKVILYADFAHIIIDGDSLDIFIRDIVSLYEKKQVEPEEISAYQLIFEEEKQEEVFLSDCKKYYDALIEKNAVIRSISAHLESGVINPVVMRPLNSGMPRLKELIEKYNASANIISSGVFGYVLAKEEGLVDSIHTVVYDNRYEAGLINTVGYLCKNLPIYCHIDEEMDWKNYFDAVKDQMRRNLIYPSTAETYMSGYYENYSDNLVVFQSDMSDDFMIDGVTAKGTLVQHPIEESTFKIVLQLFPMGDAVIAVLVLDSRYYDEAFGNHFLDAIDTILAEI